MVLIPPKEVTLTFQKKEQVAADAYEFIFDRRHGDFDFYPGQYIRMFLDIQSPDERGSTRLFSISSSPKASDFISITTRIIQSTFKKTLAELQPGSPVRFFGPIGQFIFDRADIRPRVFLAGGIGVTPFHSMIQYANDSDLTIPITLFASYRTPEDAVYYQQFSEMMKNNSWFQYVPTITQPELSKTAWSGLTGRITNDMVTEHVSDVMAALFSVAGPISMVDAEIQHLLSLGVTPEHIKKERFTGY